MTGAVATMRVTLAVGEEVEVGIAVEEGVWVTVSVVISDVVEVGVLPANGWIRLHADKNSPMRHKKNRNRFT